MFRCTKQDRSCPRQHVPVRPFERRHISLEFSFRFSNVDHLSVHSNHGPWLRHVLVGGGGRGGGGGKPKPQTSYKFSFLGGKGGRAPPPSPPPQTPVSAAACVCEPRCLSHQVTLSICALHGFCPLVASCCRLPRPCRNCPFRFASLCLACRCCSVRCLYVSQNIPICSLRRACSVTSFRLRTDSRV